MIVTDLTPHTQYEFQVRTASKNGKSKPSWPVEATTDEARPESPPKNVHSRALTSTSVIVQWEPPDIPSGVITNYIVYYWLNPSDPTEAWHKKRAGVHHADRILLSWEAPLFTSDLTAYVIKYNSTADDFTQLEVSSSKLQTAVTNLKANTDYTFQVYAKSLRGLSVPSLSVVQKTNPLVPTGAPQGVVVEALSSHELRVMWEPPPKSEQHGLITYYKIIWEAESDNGDNNDNNDKTGVVVQAAEKQRSVVISGLRPYTMHKVSVAAGTIKGFGPGSPPVIAKTFDDIPGAPRNLKLSLVNSSSVAVKWDEPVDKNGELVGYSVYVEELDAEGRPVFQGVIRPVQRTTVDTREAVVHDLKINTNYSFRVNAYNRKGDGYFVKAKTIFIPPIAPSEPRNVHADLMYHQPPLKLVLKWDEPEKTYGIPVLRYRLRYRIAGGQSDEFETLFLNDTGTTIEPLKYGRMYEFYVAAENSKGVGKESLFTVQTPTGVPDSPPMDIHYKFDAKAKTLQFSWLSPPASDHNGEIKRYQTRLTLPSGSDSITSEVNENTITYQKVEPDTKYQFSVRAGTVKGFGPWSDPVMAQAKFSESGKLKNKICSKIV
ncbi:unnamed protein product [Soboliphyme baturini]|uniref:Protein-tyrosine-phosphatase n=1 Tax=Soboliphyme baturini TaxID=241478 RepID=A0A183IFS0_9BILA|nr:unnamed protein product [Soboliphyme baturini]